MQISFPPSLQQFHPYLCTGLMNAQSSHQDRRERASGRNFGFKFGRYSCLNSTPFYPSELITKGFLSNSKGCVNPCTLGQNPVTILENPRNLFAQIILCAFSKEWNTPIPLGVLNLEENDVILMTKRREEQFLGFLFPELKVSWFLVILQLCWAELYFLLSSSFHVNPFKTIWKKRA